MFRVEALDLTELEYEDESVLIQMMYVVSSFAALALNPAIDDSLIQNAKDIDAVIERKNKEHYEAVAKMPAYSPVIKPVIKARRAEVDDMLDAADAANELRLSA